MHSSSLYQFCCWDDPEGALLMLNTFDDIDIMYKEGAIIHAIIFNNQSVLLKAVLEYFENKQFPIKDSRYEEASKLLIETLENSVEGGNSEISTIVSEYIGSDIAVLHDVSDSQEQVEEKHSALVSATVSKISNIESCIEAAKIGDVNLVHEYLDIKNRAYKVAIVSAAIHNQQERVIDAVVDIAPDARQKATVLRMVGDICTQSSLFSKAEEYYDKSLKMHPNYYVTHSKMGALYQQWSQDASLNTDTVQKLILQNKAITSYDTALEHKPKNIKYAEVQERLDIVSKQLKHLQLTQDLQDDLNVDYEDGISELLSFTSDEDDDNTLELPLSSILGQSVSDTQQATGVDQ